MKSPTISSPSNATAPGFIVVCSGMRWPKAFPVVREDGDLARKYQENPERILLQSVAAATISAHLAAAVLGYNIWGVTVTAEEALMPLLGMPPELTVRDIFLFGLRAQTSCKRWCKPLADIRNDNHFDPAHVKSDEELDEWIRIHRHGVMYNDASKID